ncbi:MAG TPA: putative metallopeptidase [Candidatus Manganitrophaceae bacterium]|nr:putative metallopeptidase [Candidatus Manganitrophaceae bacterium]
MEYIPEPTIEKEIGRIIQSLEWGHLDPNRIHVVSSRGSKSRRILARCHTLPKALQAGLAIPAHYVIELVSENYDRLPEIEKTKTLIHELMHIPVTFGGGFRNHDYVRAHRVNKFYARYIETRSAAFECSNDFKMPAPSDRIGEVGPAEPAGSGDSIREGRGMRPGALLSD